MSFGSILGAQGVQGTTFFLKKSVLWLFWRPRRHQGTPRDPEAPKMELQGSQNGRPEVPRARKTEPRRPPGIPKMEPERFEEERNCLPYQGQKIRPIRLATMSLT